MKFLNNELIQLFEISFSNKAEKFLKRAPEKLFNRLQELFEHLKQTPVPIKEYDVKKISSEENVYRIRLLSYKATYQVLWEEKQIFVAKIEKRDESTYK